LINNMGLAWPWSPVGQALVCGWRCWRRISWKRSSGVDGSGPNARAAGTAAAGKLGGAAPATPSERAFRAEGATCPGSRTTRLQSLKIEASPAASQWHCSSSRSGQILGLVCGSTIERVCWVGSPPALNIASTRASSSGVLSNNTARMWCHPFLPQGDPANDVGSLPSTNGGYRRVIPHPLDWTPHYPPITISASQSGNERRSISFSAIFAPSLAACSNMCWDFPFLRTPEWTACDLRS
jgi:hypothetical protein